MNINKMMKQAQAMQKKIQEAQEKIAALEVVGTSGGGMVSITLSGNGEAKKIKLAKEIVNPDDVEMLEDLIVAAINNAKNNAEKAAEGEMSGVTSGITLPPGMKLPF